MITLSFARGPDTLWTRYYDAFGSSEDKAYSIHQTPDGGYIIVGYSCYYGYYIYLIRTDSHGDSLWTRTLRYNANQDAMGWSVDVTNDNGYIVAASLLAGVWLLKFSDSGDTLWTRTT